MNENIKFLFNILMFYSKLHEEENSLLCIIFY